MEALGPLLLVFLLLGGWRLVVRILGAGVDTLSGGGSAEEFRARAFGMGAFEIRTRRVEATGERGFSVIEVEGRGLVPVAHQTNLSFVTSVLDCSSPQNPLPVVSTLDDFQEPESVAYSYTMRPTRVGPNEGFIDWCRVGVVIPDVLTPPRSGKRQLEVWVHLVDTARPPAIYHGFIESGRPVASYRALVEWEFDRKGYQDAAEARRQRRPLMVRLAVAVAAADGSFAEAEGKIIQRWIQRQLSVLDESVRDAVKAECNDALRVGYARAGKVSIGDLCNELNQISEPADRYEAVELCLDVMTADGQIHPAELEVIERVSDALALDYKELQRMKDQRLVTVNVQSSDESVMEASLGIGSDWAPERIRSHLREEFGRWNARLNTLTDPVERQNVQHRLDLIARARRKYAS